MKFSWEFVLLHSFFLINNTILEYIHYIRIYTLYYIIRIIYSVSLPASTLLDCYCQLSNMRFSWMRSTQSHSAVTQIKVCWTCCWNGRNKCLLAACLFLCLVLYWRIMIWFRIWIAYLFIPISLFPMCGTHSTHFAWSLVNQGLE